MWNCDAQYERKRIRFRREIFNKAPAQIITFSLELLIVFCLSFYLPILSAVFVRFQFLKHRIDRNWNSRWTHSKQVNEMMKIKTNENQNENEWNSVEYNNDCCNNGDDDVGQSTWDTRKNVCMCVRVVFSIFCFVSHRLAWHLNWKRLASGRIAYKKHFSLLPFLIVKGTS